MPKTVTVYHFTAYDTMEGKTFIVRRAATLAAIARMRGTPIPGTQHEVDEDHMDALESVLEKSDEQH